MCTNKKNAFYKFETQVRKIEIACIIVLNLFDFFVHFPRSKYQEARIDLKSFVSWKSAQSQESIAKSFNVCGLTSEENFSLEALHKPLRDCFSDDFSSAQWENEHQNLAQNVDPNNPEVETGNFVVFSEKFSLFKAIYGKINCNEDYDYWLHGTIDKVRSFIEGNDVLSSLFLSHERALFDAGSPTDTQVEIYAVAEVLKIKLRITGIDSDFNVSSKDEYNSIDGEEEVEVVMFEQNFGVEENVVNVDDN